MFLESRGYSTCRIASFESNQFYKPSPLQLASYSTNLVEMVGRRNIPKLHTVLTCGISPNPCSAQGESLMHMVCRRGDKDLLQHCFLEVFISHVDDEDSVEEEEIQHLEPAELVHCVDNNGRTVLHDACWAVKPFEVVKLLADIDVNLFMTVDNDGFTPLSYVRRDHWDEWFEFLEAVKDKYWPDKQLGDEAYESLTECESESSFHGDLGNEKAVLRDPPHALPTTVAKLVAKGDLSPNDARMLRKSKEGDNESDSDSDDETDDDETSEDGSCMTRETFATFNEEEMAGILANVQGGGAPLAWT